MTRSFIAIFAVTLALAAGPGLLDAEEASSLPVPVQELQRAALKDKRAFETLRALTEQVGNRFAGSAADPKAVAWALATLQAQGFVNVRAEPVTVPRWIRGEAHVQMIAPVPMDLQTLALGGSIGTGGAPVEAEIIAATNVDELNQLAEADVRGKIVFLYQRMVETRNGMDYGPTGRNRRDGAIAAAKLGAVGLVIRALGTEEEDRPHTGSMNYAVGVPRIPAFAVGKLSADKLLQAYARGPVRLRLASTARCAEPAQSANVIGEIPGRDASAAEDEGEQFILLGAHLDSWDVGRGAQDDGAGVVTVIESARRIGELSQRPRRSLRVVLFANEEFGTSGAERYALEHEAALAGHVAAIESDHGAGRVFRFESRVEPRDVRATLRIGEMLAPLGIAFTSNDAYGGADVGPLRERGVPVFDLRHDSTGYFQIHHTDADLLDRVDARDLAFNVAAYATVVWALADGPELQRLDRTWPEVSEGVHPCEWRPTP